jgi:hypothetical protein
MQSDMIGETELYAQNLRFTALGYPHFTNAYNIKLPSMSAKQIGMIVGGWNI